MTTLETKLEDVSTGDENRNEEGKKGKKSKCSEVGHSNKQISGNTMQIDHYNHSSTIQSLFIWLTACKG
jgi:hypothetical protein